MIRDPISGGARHRRDRLVVTGIPPVAPPETETLIEPAAWTETETEPGTAAEHTAETAGAPVFVDSTGGRARLGRRLGLAAGSVLIVFLGALGIGMATGPDVPFTPWKEPSVRPSVEPSRPPGPTREPSDQRAGGPGAGGPATGTTPAPPGSSAAAPPSSRPAPPASTSRPGKSQASPPAWGRKKKSN
ncbi:hypothetical protein E1264_13775 [Actinomadura sp. KC216]|uniref:hypothetical protein n=1 Tax=Actinomadura sp. KC216 TaxID=2530370 RepID=UPI00104A8D18|nr:hypothetical protein [Actinomadura sp. KC216]TDB87712.1 hypothetical protein E1264_13775 [Actinomadura sp. KC216]